MTAAHTPILGQARALKALGRALAGGHVHHAWIFHGPLGVGKFRTAEEFARILLDLGERFGVLTPSATTRPSRMNGAATPSDSQVNPMRPLIVSFIASSGPL